MKMVENIHQLRMAAELKNIAFVHHFTGHELKLMKSLYLQWKGQDCCDLVIVAQNGSLTVHACVMAAFSPKIVSLLSEKKLENKCSASSINTIEVQFKYDVMEAIVVAIYTGIFQPPAKFLNEVLLASQWLKITELANILINYIDKQQHNKRPLLYENSCKEISPAALSRTLNYSQVAWHQQVSDVETSKQQSDNLSSNLNIETPAVNIDPKSRMKKSFRRKNNTVPKSPVADTTSSKPNRKNEWVEIYFHNFSSNNVTEQAEYVPEDDNKNNTQKQVNVMITRSSKTIKKRGPCSSEIVHSKRRKARTKLNESRKQPPQKTSKRKVKESIASSKSTKLYDKERVKSVKSDQVKAESEVLDNLQSPIKDEVHSDDPDKEVPTAALDNASVIKCKKCYAKFTNVDLYNSHIQDHPTFECDQCHQLFLSKFTLSKHIRSIHYGREYLMCRHCNFVARSQVELRKHAASAHNDIKPFPCSYAGCTFTAVKHSQVLKHMIIHSEEKVFRCNKCNRKFLRETGLESHQKACFQLQEFLCDLCGQSFNHIHSMRKHRRAIHFGEKPYKCSVCSNSFGDHRNLHRHMLIHENSFPYSCPVCRQQFRHSNSLKAHVSAKHKDHPENILQDFSNGSLGGVSYKRVLKHDLVKSKASRTARDGGRTGKKWSYKVKREVLSPTEIFESTTFPGDFLSHPEDGSSSNDLEFGIEGVRHSDGYAYSSKNEDQNMENRGVMEEDSREVSHVSQCENASCYQLRPQIPPEASLGWTEIMKSPQHVPVGQAAPPSLGQSGIQTSSLSPPNKSVPIVNTSEFTEAYTKRAMPMPDLSAYHLSNPQLGTQKLLQQSSQHALEKFLSQQNRSSVGKPKLAIPPKIFKAANTLDSSPTSSFASSQPLQTLNPCAKSGITSASSKSTNLWKETAMEQVCSGFSTETQKCFPDFRCYSVGGQLPPDVSISQSGNSLPMLENNVVLLEQGSGNIDKLT